MVPSESSLVDPSSVIGVPASALYGPPATAFGGTLSTGMSVVVASVAPPSSRTVRVTLYVSSSRY